MEKDLVRGTREDFYRFVYRHGYSELVEGLCFFVRVLVRRNVPLYEFSYIEMFLYKSSHVSRFFSVMFSFIENFHQCVLIHRDFSQVCSHISRFFSIIRIYRNFSLLFAFIEIFLQHVLIYRNFSPPCSHLSRFFSTIFSFIEIFLQHVLIYRNSSLSCSHLSRFFSIMFPHIERINKRNKIRKNQQDNFQLSRRAVYNSLDLTKGK